MSLYEATFAGHTTDNASFNESSELFDLYKPRNKNASFTLGGARGIWSGIMNRCTRQVVRGKRSNV
jgi:hypothetical protein